MPINSQWYDVRTADSAWDRLAFRLERRLLAPGPTGTGRLRGYLRAKAWRDLRSRRARLRAIRGAVLLPLRALRESRRAVAAWPELAALVEREHGVPRARQVRHLWWLWVRYGIDRPDVYYGFRLFLPGQLHRGGHFLQADEADRLYRLLSLRTSREQAELLLDKGRFERWLDEQGIPTPRTLLECAGGRVVRAALPHGRLPACDLFSKPNDALKGQGTERWRRDGDGWVGEDGVRRDEAALLETLAERSQGRRLLVQERLVNHAELRAIAPGALSTIRVVTLRGLDDVVRVVVAVCKLPSGGAATDHMLAGGVAAPVDLATGTLGDAVRKDAIRIVVPCDRHPDTGVPLRGVRVPHWERVKELAVRTHERLGPILCVGWDIAVLDDGPVIIEGNDNPGHASSQLPTGIGLGETPIVPALLARLEAAFAARPTGRSAAPQPGASGTALPTTDRGR